MTGGASSIATPAATAFVVCPSFHGATLLAMLLSRHYDVVHLGDTLPSRSIDQACSCGVTVDECPFWQGLLETVDLARFRDQNHHWMPRYPRFTSQHRVNWGLSFTVAALNGLLGTALDVTASCEAATYRRTFDAFVNYATSRSGATVFVDGTKSVVRALYLMSGQERPSRVIHLFRDPRGVAWSQMSRGQVGARAAARSWRFQHEFATVALRWLSPLPPLKLRYEDLASRPDVTVPLVLGYLGAVREPQRLRPPGETHVIGNRMVKTFHGDVHLDEGWRSGLSASDARDILRWSGPLAQRLGYR